MASTNTQTAVAPTTVIRSAGANLFALASLYMADATQWNRIATFNNLNPPDPWQTGIVVLEIPAPDSNSSGGIYGT